MAHELITHQQRAVMLANGAKSATGENIDPKPVVKLFMPGMAMTWLLTELDPEMPDVAFGLCDLGFGTPELGSVSISEITSVRSKFGLSVERDLYFTPDKTLSAYADEASRFGFIQT